MDDLIAILSVVLGTVLIVAQVALAFQAAKTAAIAATAAKAAAEQNKGLAPMSEKFFDAVGKLADKAPLLTGGILLYVLAAFVSGAVDLNAAVTTK